MSERESFFRTEALQHWADRKGPGNLLRAPSRWLDVVFWLVVAIFAAGLVLSYTFEVATYAVAPVTYDDENGTLSTQMPEKSRGKLAPGARVDVRALDGTWIRGLVAEPTATGEVRLHPPPAASIDLRSLSGGSARIPIGTEPILTAFVPGVRSLEGE